MYYLGFSDFRGINPNGFDGRGNYNLGLTEQLMFPEISYDDVTQLRGFDIAIVTTAKTDEEARALLKGFGMPFTAALVFNTKEFFKS